MNKILGFVMVLNSFWCFSQNGLQNVIVERLDASMVMDSAFAYRVYIDLDSNYALQQIYGDDLNPLSISTTTSWYNHSSGSVFGNEILESLFGLNDFEGLIFDSYISLGASSNSTYGVEIKNDFDTFKDGRVPIKNGKVPNVKVLGKVDLQSNFSIEATSGIFQIDGESGGHCFTFISNANIVPENRILIGQFTTNGTFAFSLNIQTKILGSDDFFVIKASDEPRLNYSSKM